MKARSLAALLLPAMVLMLVGLVALVAPAKPPAATAVESTRPRAVSRPILARTADGSKGRGRSWPTAAGERRCGRSSRC